MHSFNQLATAFSVLAGYVAAHGHITGIRADNVYYQGYNSDMQFMPQKPKIVAWSIPQVKDNGPIYPRGFASPDIICHIGATPGALSATVTAGSKMTLYWTRDWPYLSHKGPMLDYLAPCANGDCATVDKTTLKFFKIDAAGLVPGAPEGVRQQNRWASDDMAAGNYSWSVTVPASIAPGPYVLRTETIALHEGYKPDGAQNYPFCLNLIVKGSGTAQPEGVPGMKLYTPEDPGIKVDIYKKMDSYAMPGPPVFTG